MGFNLFLCGQLFFSYVKELVGKKVIVELKNILAICGTLHSVDQYLNIKLRALGSLTRRSTPTWYVNFLSATPV
jgi:hypothetical protein